MSVLVSAREEQAVRSILAAIETVDAVAADAAKRWRHVLALAAARCSADDFVSDGTASSSKRALLAPGLASSPEEEEAISAALAQPDGQWTVAGVREHLPPSLLPLPCDRPALYLHCAHGLHRSGSVAAALVLRRLLRAGHKDVAAAADEALAECVAARQLVGETHKLSATRDRLIVLAPRLLGHSTSDTC